MSLQKTFLDKQHEKLISDKQKIEQDLARFTVRDGDSFKVIWNEKGPGDEDNADESRDYADALALQGTLTSELTDINTALSHIEDGTYGCCSGCGTDIAEARLEARPMATLCITCQEKSGR